MSKIGTAHVEIKPVLNEDALKEMADRIEAAVRKAVRAGLSESTTTTDVGNAGTRNCPCRPENGGSGICGCVLGGPRITC